MRSWEMNKTRLELDGSFCLLLSLMLLILPIQWVAAMVLGAFVHECFHFAAITVLGGRIFGIHLGLGGTTMEAEPLTPGKELLAAVSGPIGSGLLILLARWLPRTAICGAVHLAFNLLPLFPMDGGRIIRSFCRMLFRNGEVKFRVFQKIAGILVVFFCLFCSIRFGIWVAVFGAVFLLGQKGRELFDKRFFLRYNKTDNEYEEVGL